MSIPASGVTTGLSETDGDISPGRMRLDWFRLLVFGHGLTICRSYLHTDGDGSGMLVSLCQDMT